MSKVKKVWRQGEKPVNLTLLFGPLGTVGAGFGCPGCGKPVGVDYEGEELFFHCQCGAHLRLTVGPRLEELEGEDG